MPKLKPSPVTATSEIVMRNICALGEICGAKTDGEKAKKIGMSASTFSERRKNPRNFRLEELIFASMALKCSMAWLVTDHSGEYREYKGES